MNENSPIHRQWLGIKNKTDAVLLFQIGDFYELFKEDALLVAPLLNLTITARHKKKNASAKMAGFPKHVAGFYVSKIINNGYKVAICDQVANEFNEDNIVHRQITRILTAGMILEEDGLDPYNSNFIIALVRVKDVYSIANLEWSTGRFYITILKDKNKVINEIGRINPSEILIYKRKDRDIADIISILKKRNTFRVEYIKRSDITSLVRVGFLDEKIRVTSSILSCNMILSYILITQNLNLTDILYPKFYEVDNFLIIDAATLTAMGIKNSFDRNKNDGMLINLLTKYAQTNMGKRYITDEISRPSMIIDKIKNKQDLVEFFVNNDEERNILVNELKNIGDLERLIGKYTNRRFNYTDLYSLKEKIIYSKKISILLKKSNNIKVIKIGSKIDELNEVFEILEKITKEDIPDNNDIKLNNKSFFKEGYNKELDEYLINIEKYNNDIRLIEIEEQIKTNIKSLKIKHNRQDEHYIHITKVQFNKIKKKYNYNVTLNASNYVKIEKNELTEASKLLLENKEKKKKIEDILLKDIVKKIVSYSIRLYKTARLIAFIDSMCAFAIISRENNYVKPIILSKEKRYFSIKQARHPVIESLIKKTSVQFVPNDLYLAENSSTIIITGPNMGGKSTILKQVAIIQILAQAGCFIPAESGFISICDRIFARTGASDNLLYGQSTFMVESTEIATICRNATAASLILFDEICQGTNYHDGISIAISVIDHLNAVVYARTICVTHHYEISILERISKGTKNYCVGINKVKGEINFLYTLMRGIARSSYGIQIARLAGMPDKIILKAHEIVKILQV